MGVGCYSSEAAGWASKRATVNLCSKGLARKENPPLRDIDLSPDKIFFSFSYAGYKRISVPLNPLQQSLTVHETRSMLTS